jgi:hypothetical protein
VSAEEPGADGPTMGRGKRLRRAIQPYRTALWLLALAIVFGVVAYLIYPTDAPAAPQDAVQGVGVVANFTPSAIAVIQTSDAATDGFRLQIILYAKGQVPHTGTVTIVLRRRGDRTTHVRPRSAAAQMAPASRTPPTTCPRGGRTPGKRRPRWTTTSYDKPSPCPTSGPT